MRLHWPLNRTESKMFSFSFRSLRFHSSFRWPVVIWSADELADRDEPVGHNSKTKIPVFIEFGSFFVFNYAMLNDNIDVHSMPRGQMHRDVFVCQFRLAHFLRRALCTVTFYWDTPPNRSRFTSDSIVNIVPGQSHIHRTTYRHSPITIDAFIMNVLINGRMHK